MLEQAAEQGKACTKCIAPKPALTDITYTWLCIFTSSAFDAKLGYRNNSASIAAPQTVQAHQSTAVSALVHAIWHGST